MLMTRLERPSEEVNQQPKQLLALIHPSTGESEWKSVCCGVLCPAGMDVGERTRLGKIESGKNTAVAAAESTGQPTRKFNRQEERASSG